MRLTTFWSWFWGILWIITFWSAPIVFTLISERRSQKHWAMVRTIRREALSEAVEIAEQHKALKTASAIRELMEAEL